LRRTAGRIKRNAGAPGAEGYNQLPKVILGVKFTDGIEVVRSQAQTAAAGSLPSPTFGDSSFGVDR